MAKKATAFTAPVDDEHEALPPATTAAAPSSSASAALVVTEPAAPAVPQAKSLPSYRVGKRNLSAWIDEKAFNEFKSMAASDGKTIQTYMIEMVNREFARKGRPQIAK